MVLYNPQLRNNTEHRNEIIDELKLLIKLNACNNNKYYLVIDDDNTINQLKNDMHDIHDYLIENSYFGGKLQLNTKIYSASSVYELLFKMHNNSVIDIIECVYSSSHYYELKDDWKIILLDTYNHLNALCKSSCRYIGNCNGIIELDIIEPY